MRVWGIIVFAFSQNSRQHISLANPLVNTIGLRKTSPEAAFHYNFYIFRFSGVPSRSIEILNGTPNGEKITQWYYDVRSMLKHGSSQGHHNFRRGQQYEKHTLAHIHTKRMHTRTQTYINSKRLQRGN